MSAPDDLVAQIFFDALKPADQRLVASLDSAVKIQQFLDTIPYNGGEDNRAPLRVMQERQCHCLDGGLLAAHLLARLGHPPKLVDMLPVPGIDDDHVLAVFRVNGLWGCVAKSNFTGLRYRDPVYRSIRELVMSYFEGFYNIDGIKTLRGYTRPLDLRRYDRWMWTTEQAGTDRIIKRLYSLSPVPVVPSASIPLIARLDERTYASAFLGVNMDELYKPH
jgi:hypothetical protein